MFSSLTAGSPSAALLMCLGRLESHLTTCGGRGLVNEQLSLADIVVWSTLYMLLAPDATATEGNHTPPLILTPTHTHTHTHTHTLILTHTHTVYHQNYPKVCAWFISLAQQEIFTAAVWRASNDAGYEAYKLSVLGQGSKVTAPAPPTSGLPSSEKPSKVTVVGKEESKSKSVPVPVRSSVCVCVCVCVCVHVSVAS